MPLITSSIHFIDMNHADAAEPNGARRASREIETAAFHRFGTSLK
jgi:hypothetical protein